MTDINVFNNSTLYILQKSRRHCNQLIDQLLLNIQFNPQYISTSDNRYKRLRLLYGSTLCTLLPKCNLAINVSRQLVQFNPR